MIPPNRNARFTPRTARTHMPSWLRGFVVSWLRGFVPPCLRAFVPACLFILLPSLSACGYSSGPFLYYMGVGGDREAEAEFTLTKEGTVLILVDDPEERLASPYARTTIANDLARELATHQAVGEVVSQETLQRLRQRNTDFEERGCREVGRLANAEQVLWVQVRDYLAETDPTEVTGSARMAVTVKVINALEEKDAEKVRLWPQEREGRIVTTELDAATVVRSAKEGQVVKMLTEKLVAEIAKPFYNRVLGDFE